jgi:hypothetical protein
MSKRGDLTTYQLDVLLRAHEGKTNAQIATATGLSPGSIASILSSVKRKGYAMPEWRPREPRAEREYQKMLAGLVSRFTAEGTKESTGERFTVTADDQAFADAHLAAMLEDSNVF